MSHEIKIATFNVEWMVNLFKNGTPARLTKPSKTTPGSGAKPKDPQGVATRIAAVIREVDADNTGICEGPPLKSQMETFVKEKLGGDYDGYSMEDGPQSVHALVHKRLNANVTVFQLPRRDKVFERLRTVRTYVKRGDLKIGQKSRFTLLPVILRLQRNGSITELMVSEEAR